MKTVGLIGCNTGYSQIELRFELPGKDTYTMKKNIYVGDDMPYDLFVPEITPSVSNVTTEIYGNYFHNVANTATIPLFDLNNIYGSSFDDRNISKTTPTAMHALLYNLELKYDSDGTSNLQSENWDWDWVQANTTMGLCGTVVQKVGVNNLNSGAWYCEINDVIQPLATACELDNNDKVEWHYNDHGKFMWGSLGLL